jgi:hypothetical protein
LNREDPAGRSPFRWAGFWGKREKGLFWGRGFSGISYENNAMGVRLSIGIICPIRAPIGKRSLFRFWGFEFSGKKCEFSCLFFQNRDYLRFFGEIPEYRGLKCALIAPIGRPNSIFMGYWLRKQKRGYAKLWKNPVDLPTALYPVSESRRWLGIFEDINATTTSFSLS